MKSDSLDSKQHDWAADAACIGMDPEIFFPPPKIVATQAKKVCLSCKVREECLEFALANGEHFGIWGGKSDRERRRLRVKLGYSFDSRGRAKSNSLTQETTSNDE